MNLYKKIISFLIILIIGNNGFTQEPYLIKTIKKHSESVNAVAFSSDGKYFASGGDDKKLILWNNITNEEILSIEEGFYKIRAIAFSPDCSTFAVASGRGIKLFEINGTYINTFLGHTTDIWSICFSHNGRYLVSGSFDKTFRLWEIKSFKTIHIFKGHEKSVLAVAFSPDGKYIVSGSLDQTIKLWDTESRQEIRTYKGHFDNIYSITFDSSSKYFLSASRDKTVRLWDIEKEERLYTFRKHVKSVFSVCFSPDTKYFLSSSLDKSIVLCELGTGKVLNTFSGHEASVNAIDISPDGKKMISASYDNTIKIWDISIEIFIDQYFAEEFEKDLQESTLFESKRKGESKTTYNERLEKANQFKKQLYSKYYEKYLQLPHNKVVISNQLQK